MIRSTVAIAVLIAVTSGSRAADPTPSDKAIAEAIAVLEKAARKAKGEEADRLRRVIDAISEASKKEEAKTDPSKPEEAKDDVVVEVTPAQFAAKPEKFAGKTLKMKLVWADRLAIGSMRAISGKTPFEGQDAKGKAILKLTIDIPNGTPLPSVLAGVPLVVVFKTEGKRDGGNTVVSVEKAQ